MRKRWSPAQREQASGLKSIRRREFRNNAQLFAQVLMLPGVGTYLRETFREDPDLDECLSDESWSNSVSHGR